MNQPAPPVDYRLAPSTTLRLVGLALVCLAVLMFVGTALVALADLSPAILAVPFGVGLVGVLTLGWYLRSAGWVLRCTADGYQVRMVRGAGVRQARWEQVGDAVAATRHGVACLVLDLRDGGTTTIPVGLLAVDKDIVVRELQARLQQASGLRPWRGAGEPTDSD